MSNIIFTKLSIDLLDLMLLLQHRLVRPHDMVRECSIPPSHVKVIYFLKDKGSYSMSEAATILNISRSNMTPIVDKLIAEGLLVRFEDKDDRRIIRIEITEKATEFLLSIEERIKDTIREKLSTLSIEDATALSENIINALKIISKTGEKR